MIFNRGTTTPRGRALGAATVAVLAAAGTLVAVPAAQAAAPAAPAATHLSQGGIRTTFTIPPGVSTYRASSGSARITVTRSPEVSPGLAINCTVTTTNPFRFYGGPIHYPLGSGVEAMAHVTCTNIVNTLDLVVALIQGSTIVAANETVAYSTLQAAADTEAAYSPGWTWTTGAVGSADFPDGTYGESDPAYSAATYIP